MRSPRSSRPSRGPRSGSLLVETLIALSLLTLVLLSSMAMVESGRRFSDSTLQITNVEDLAQQMLFRIEHELARATGASGNPVATLTAPLTAGETALLQVPSTAGFPPRGWLLLDRGSANEERLAYASIAGLVHFAGLTRGEQCTGVFDHAQDGDLDVLWAGLAEPLEDQVAPAASEYDGIALEAGQGIYFRGDGVGFSYRVPVDPSGGNNPLSGHDLQWGAVVTGVGPTLDGWSALVFQPERLYVEADTGDDVNRDGDTLDTYDVGQIRRLTWDTSDPTRFDDLGLGPSNVLQERCNWGGDLDSDGFADPIFLWDARQSLLHVRLFLLGATIENVPIVRAVESVVYLRNEPDL